MLRFKFIDNVELAFTTNKLVVGADLFYTCTDFHFVSFHPDPTSLCLKSFEGHTALVY